METDMVDGTGSAPDMKSEVLVKYAKNLRQAGKMTEFVRVLLSGEPKAGKSRLAAGFPSPIIAIDTGEGGIEQYLDAEAGDRALYARDHDEVADIVDDLFVEFEKGIWKSLLVDSYSVFWDDILDWSREELTKKNKDEAQYADWGWIKKSNRSLRKNLMALQGHACLTAWLKDTEMTQDENTPPGVKAKTKVMKVSKASVEKTIPYFFDYWFELEKKLDKVGHPTGEHTVQFCGGRVPEAIPADALYCGRMWTFNSRRERKPIKEVWNEVIGWTLPFRSVGGTAVWVGLDAEEGERIWKDARAEVDDEVLGRIVGLMLGVETLAEYQKVYHPQILPLTVGLTKDGVQKFLKLHQLRKQELESKSGDGPGKVKVPEFLKGK